MRLFLAVAFTLLLTWPAGAHAERRGADSMLVKAATPCDLGRAIAVMLSKAGDHMLIEVRFRCGGLCGSGTVMHYRKTPKGWLRMDPLALYIS